MQNIKCRSKVATILKGAFFGLIGLTVGGLSIHAQTTTVSTKSTLSSVNSGDNYIFSDIASFDTSNLAVGIPANVTMNSLQLGGSHGFDFGTRTLTLTSGNLSFASTGSNTGFTRLAGTTLVSSTTNLNVTQNMGAVQLMTSISGTSTSSVTYSGSGPIFLLRDSTYGGGTIVNSQVHANSANALSTGVVTVNSGGGLHIGGTTINVGSLVLAGGSLNISAQAQVASLNQTSIGTLALTSNSTINFVTPSAESYAFADSSLQSWTGNLTLNGFTMGTDSIRFGTSGDALTLDQKQRIKLASDPSMLFDLNSNGYLIAAIPEPSTYAMVLVSIMTIGLAYRRRLA